MLRPDMSSTDGRIPAVVLIHGASVRNGVGVVRHDMMEALIAPYDPTNLHLPARMTPIAAAFKGILNLVWLNGYGSFSIGCRAWAVGLRLRTWFAIRQKSALWTTINSCVR
jgi:hypothetical protein